MIAVGQCFPWANRYAMNHLDTHCKIAHGMIHQPCTSDPPYWHAWVEDDGKVYDWQCMEAGYGGNYKKIGYPIDVFYELYHPTNVRFYSPKDILKLLHTHKHHGPW